MKKPMTRMNEAVQAMQAAKIAQREACHAAWLAALDTVPEVRTALEEFGISAVDGEGFFCGVIIDQEKTGVELIVEGRFDEVLTRLRQIIYCVYT